MTRNARNMLGVFAMLALSVGCGGTLGGDGQTGTLGDDTASAQESPPKGGGSGDTQRTWCNCNAQLGGTVLISCQGATCACCTQLGYNGGSPKTQ